MKTSLIPVLLFLVFSCNSGNEKAGSSQTAPVSISDSSKEANCVNLTADEKDVPVVSWCETDKKTGQKSFYMSLFDARGNSFLTPIEIPLEQTANLHEEGMPKVAFKENGTIVAVYETATTSEKNRFAGFVKYIVSTDKGKTWTTPTLLHSDTSRDNSHSFPAIARVGDGEVAASWLDQSPDPKIPGRPVKFAKTNNQNAFANEITIDSIACQCCRIAISSGSAGRILIAFRDIMNDSIRDMSIVSSEDNGKTFLPAVPFSNDGWVINGCPHNGPSLALAGDTAHAAWFAGGRERGVFYSELNNQKEAVKKRLLSSRGRFVQLCLLGNGSPVLAYNENLQEEGKSYNRILLNRIQDDKVFGKEITMEKSMAGYPVLQRFGTDGVLVAWTSNGKVYYHVDRANDINTAMEIQKGHSTTEPIGNLSNVKLANSRDLVCGMPLSLSPADTTLFGQKVYGFCSQLCKNAFLEKPASFAVK